MLNSYRNTPQPVANYNNTNQSMGNGLTATGSANVYFGNQKELTRGNNSATAF